MKKNLIVDDELRAAFADLPAGVRLTVVSDSCFSGSVTRGDLPDTPDDRGACASSTRGASVCPRSRACARKAKPRSVEALPAARDEGGAGVGLP